MFSTYLIVSVVGCSTGPQLYSVDETVPRLFDASHPGPVGRILASRSKGPGFESHQVQVVHPWEDYLLVFPTPSDKSINRGLV